MMRKLGELNDRAQAVRFCDYLLTKNISAMAELGDASDDHWVIWIRDEDRLEEGRADFVEFRANPTDEKYNVASEADRIRRQREADNKERLKLQRKMGGRPAWSGAGANLHQKPRLTITLIVICVILFLVTDSGGRRNREDSGNDIFESLTFVTVQDYVQSHDPLATIKKGEVWRVFTPNLLHGSMMHLGFNMLALFFLGGVIERLQSPKSLAGLIVFTGVIAIVVQALFPEKLGGSPFVVGISGAIYGLFGYLWVRPILQPSFPNVMPSSTVMLMLLFMVIFIVMPRGSMGGHAIANVAHVAGLFAGIACAFVATRLPS
ncbi:MAG: rhomboid family intramembrane serine protease [Pirellulaceae bacterium]